MDMQEEGALLINRARMRAEVEHLIRRVNAELGAPMDPFVQVGGSRISRIGHYHLDHATSTTPGLDGWALVRFTTIHGDTTMVLPRQSLWALRRALLAFLKGAHEQRTWTGARS